MRSGWWSTLALVLIAACSSGSKSARPDPVVLMADGGAGGSEDVNAAAGSSDTFVPSHPERLGPPCNTWPALCERAYDAVTFPVTHAAMANSSTFWSYPAQQRTIREQLDDSIRGLWLEVHPHEAGPTLCFNDCSEGRAPLLGALDDVRGFLDDNPREVVTLLIDNRVPAAEIEQALADADLTRYVRSDERPRHWPTLGEMIEAGERLVVFLSDASDAGAGFLSFADLAETTENAHTARELTCDFTRGDAKSAFVLVNHFLVEESEGGEAGAPAIGRPSESLAAQVNREPLLSERLRLCSRVPGRKPNFVAVDFYAASDIVTATQRLDGLIPGE